MPDTDLPTSPSQLQMEFVAAHQVEQHTAQTRCMDRDCLRSVARTALLQYELDFPESSPGVLSPDRAHIVGETAARVAAMDATDRQIILEASEF